jgi:hypothetical protein
MRVAVCLILCSCARPAPLAPAPPPPPWCRYDVTQNPSLGQERRIGFAYLPAVSQKLESPLAAGGSRTEILALSASSTPPVRNVVSSHPEVASFTLASVGGSICQNQALLLVRTGVPGTTELELYDDGGNQVDRVAVSVAATRQLELDRSFNEAAPARILAGSLQGVHATTLGDSGVLVGTGAVRFRLEGDLFPFPDRDAAPPWWGGDAVTFTGNSGRGRVLAQVGGLEAALSVEVLAASSLGEVTLTAEPVVWPAPVELTVAADAGGAPVYGAQCQWSWPFEPPEWVYGGWIGDEPAAHYRFSAPRKGRFVAECLLPGRRRQQVELRFE